MGIDKVNNKYLRNTPSEFSPRHKDEIPDEIPNTVEKLRTFIKDIIRCPIYLETGNEELQSKLLNHWIQICRKYEIDYETKYISYQQGGEDEVDFQLDEDSFDELRPAAINLFKWHKEANQEFLNNTKVFSIHMADSIAQNKHYPMPALSHQEISKKSKSGTSIFYKHITNSKLETLLPQIFEDNFNSLLKKPESRFAVRCINNIGFSFGVDTNILIVDISTELAHAYPMLETEAKQKNIKISNTNLL